MLAFCSQDTRVVGTIIKIRLLSFLKTVPCDREQKFCHRHYKVIGCYFLIELKYLSEKLVDTYFYFEEVY